jgi:hypothetical protein
MVRRGPPSTVRPGTPSRAVGLEDVELPARPAMLTRLVEKAPQHGDLEAERRASCHNQI